MEVGIIAAGRCHCACEWKGRLGGMPRYPCLCLCGPGEIGEHVVLCGIRDIF